MLNQNYIWVLLLLFFAITMSSCDNPAEPFDRGSRFDPLSENYDPGSISNLITYFDDEGIIRLSWSDVKYESGYIVEKKISEDADYNQLAVLSENMSSYADSSNEITTSTMYRVSAFKDHENKRIVADPDSAKLTVFYVRSIESRFIEESNSYEISWEIDSPFLKRFELSSEDHLISENQNSLEFEQASYTHIDPLTDISFQNRHYRFRGYLETEAMNETVIDTVISFDVLDEFSPSRIEVSVINEAKVKISWEDNSFFEDGFRLYNEITGELIADLSAGITDYETNEPIEAFGKVIFSVHAYQNNNSSKRRSGEDVFFFVLPDLVLDKSNRELREEINFFIEIPDNSLVQEYVVYRSDAYQINFEEIARLPGYSGNFTDNNLDVGNHYLYRIKTLSTTNHFNPLSEKLNTDLELIYSDIFRLRSSFLAHGPDNISSIDISADGNYMATTAYSGLYYGDNQIKIWNLNNYSLHTTISTHQNIVNSARIHPDGDKLISTSRNEEKIYIHSFPDGNLLEVDGNTDGFDVINLSFDNTGEYIAGINFSGVLFKWTFDEMKLEFSHPSSTGSGASFNVVSFSNDGKWIAGKNEKVVVIDASTGERIVHIDNWVSRNEFITGMTFSRDDRYLIYFRRGRTLEIVDTSNWNLLHRDNRFNGNDVQLHPLQDTQMIAVRNGSFVEYDFTSFKYKSFFNFELDPGSNGGFRVKYIDENNIIVGFENGYIRNYERTPDKHWKVFR